MENYKKIFVALIVYCLSFSVVSYAEVVEKVEVKGNQRILKDIVDLQRNLGFQILMGISRKSFLEYNNDRPKDRLPATLGVTALLVNYGIDIIRVHDVEEHIKSRMVLTRMFSKHSGELYGC